MIVFTLNNSAIRALNVMFVLAVLSLLLWGADASQKVLRPDTLRCTKVWLEGSKQCGWKGCGSPNDLCPRCKEPGTLTLEKRGSRLSEAALKGEVDTLLKLINGGSNVNAAAKDGTTALICAALCNHGLCLETLLDYGADVNQANNNGETALILAASKGHFSCVFKLTLLHYKANINARDNDEATALVWAARKYRLDCVQWLIYKGAEVDATDMYGKTALW